MQSVAILEHYTDKRHVASVANHTTDECTPNVMMLNSASLY